MEGSFRVLSESNGSDRESSHNDSEVNHEDAEELVEETELQQNADMRFITTREEPGNILVRSLDSISDKSSTEDKTGFSFNNPIAFGGNEEQPSTQFHNFLFDEALTNEVIDEVDEDKEEDEIIANELALEQERVIKQCAARMIGFFFKGYLKRYLRDVFDKIYEEEAHFSESELKERKILLISKLNLKFQLKAQLAMTKRFNYWKSLTHHAPRRSYRPSILPRFTGNKPAESQNLLAPPANMLDSLDEPAKPKQTPANNLFAQIKLGIPLNKALKATKESSSSDLQNKIASQPRESVSTPQKSQAKVEMPTIRDSKKLLMSYIPPPEIDLKALLEIDSIPPSNSGKIIEANALQNDDIASSPSNKESKSGDHPLKNLLHSISIGGAKKARQSTTTRDSVTTRQSVTQMEPKPRDSNIPKSNQDSPEKKPDSKIDVKAFGNLNALFAKKPPQTSAESTSQQISAPKNEQENNLKGNLEGLVRVPGSKILVARGTNVLPVPDIDLRAHMPELPPAPKVETESVEKEKPAGKIDAKAFGNLNALFAKKPQQETNPEPEKPAANKIDAKAFGNLNALFAKKTPPATVENVPEKQLAVSATPGLQKPKILLAQGSDVLPVPDIDLREYMPDLPPSSSVAFEPLTAQKPAANKVDVKAFDNLNALFAKKPQQEANKEPEKPANKIDTKAFGNLNALFAKKPPPATEEKPSVPATNVQEAQGMSEYARVPNTKILLAQGANLLPLPDIDLREHMPDLPPTPQVVVQPVSTEKPAGKIDTKAFGNLNALFAKKPQQESSPEPEKPAANKIDTKAFGNLNALFAKKPAQATEEKPSVPATDVEKAQGMPGYARVPNTKILLAQGANLLPLPDIDLREHMPALPPTPKVEIDQVPTEKPAGKIDTKAFGNLNALFAKKPTAETSTETEKPAANKIDTKAFGNLNALFAKKPPPTSTENQPESKSASSQQTQSIPGFVSVPNTKILLAHGTNVLAVPNINLREHMPDLPPTPKVEIEQEKPTGKIDTKAFGNLNALFAKKPPAETSTETEKPAANKIDTKAFGNLNALFAKKPPPASTENEPSQQTQSIPGFISVPNTKILLAQGANVLAVPDIDLRAHMPDLPPTPKINAEPEKPAGKIDAKAFGNLNALFAKKLQQEEAEKPAAKIDTKAFGNLNALFAKKPPQAAPASASSGPTDLSAENKILNSKIVLGEGPSMFPPPNVDLKRYMPSLVTVASVSSQPQEGSMSLNIPNSKITLGQGPNVLPPPNIDMKKHIAELLGGKSTQQSQESAPKPQPPKLDIKAGLNALFAGKAPAQAGTGTTTAATTAKPATTTAPAVRTPSQGLVSKKAHINAIPKYKLQGTFWTAPTTAAATGLKNIELDFGKLEEVFFQKAEEVEKAAAKVQAQPKSTLIALLEAKKVNNTSIVLSSFSKNTDEVVDVIAKCGTSISLEQLQKIMSILPTDEERKLLEEYKDDLNKISPAERFLKKLVAIPRLNNRVQSMVFSLNFNNDFEDYTENMLVLNYPFNLLKNEKRFQYVLQLLLQICNFMNFGTPKANATGFTLDCLMNLDTLKGFDKKTSPLVYLVNLIKSQDERYLDFIGDFLNFDKATKFEMVDFEKKLKEFHDGINKIKEECDNINKILETVEDEELGKTYESFIDRFGPFVQEGNLKANQFDKNLKSLKDDILKVGQLYGENKDYKTKAFLGLLMTFAQTLKTIKAKLEEKPKEPPKEKPKPAVVNKPAPKGAHELPGLKQPHIHKPQPTYKERASITMRNTIRQLRKDIGHTKNTKDTMLLKQESDDTERKGAHGQARPSHMIKPNEGNKNFTVVKSSGIISFH